MKMILMLVTAILLTTEPIMVETTSKDPVRPESIEECIEFINTEFGYHYLCPDKVYEIQYTKDQYDYCIGLACEGYIDEAYKICIDYTQITPEIREEYGGKLRDDFTEVEDLVNKTAILHFLYY